MNNTEQPKFLKSCVFISADRNIDIEDLLAIIVSSSFKLTDHLAQVIGLISNFNNHAAVEDQINLENDSWVQYFSDLEVEFGYKSGNNHYFYTDMVDDLSEAEMKALYQLQMKVPVPIIGAEDIFNDQFYSVLSQDTVDSLVKFKNNNGLLFKFFDNVIKLKAKGLSSNEAFLKINEIMGG